MDAQVPDWWGAIGETATNLTDDRYIASVEIREVNDVPRGDSASKTVGGLFLFHHANFGLLGPGGEMDSSSRIPAHEVGRNADIFDPKVGRLLKAGSVISFHDNHLHANGRETKARLELGFTFHPKSTCRRSSSVASASARPRSTFAKRGEPADPRIHRAAGERKDSQLRTAHARHGDAHVRRGDSGR